MKISRRSFLSSAGAGTVSLSMGGLLSATACSQPSDIKTNSFENDSQALFIGDDIAIAQT